MGGSSLWVKNGRLSLRDVNYEKKDELSFADFEYDDTLQNELNQNILDTINELTENFPELTDNISGRQDELSFNKDLCSLYDSAHDFGEFKINYDILSKHDDDTKLYVDRMSFSVLGMSNFGLQINNVSTDFYKEYSNLNTASLGGGTVECAILSKDLENLFLFAAMKYSKNKNTGIFQKVDGIAFKQVNEEIRDEILNFFNEYKVNKITGNPEPEDSDDFIIPVVIDANKKLFKTKDNELWENFCYLLTQEGIADPSPKKNPIKKNGLNPFDEERFFYETPNISNKRTYSLQDISGIIEPSFNIMESFKVEQTFRVKKDGIVTPEVKKEILLNQQKHPNSIEVLRKRYNNNIVKDKNCELNIPSDFIPTDPKNFYDNNKFIATDIIPQQQIQEIKANRFNSRINNTNLTELIKETIDIFTSKRYGDQLQANCVRYINTWKDNSQNGIEFTNLAGSSTNFKPQRAVLVTHDRMLFAYAIYNNIPVIFDYGKVLMVYKPNNHSEIPAQLMPRTPMAGGSGKSLKLNTNLAIPKNITKNLKNYITKLQKNYGETLRDIKKNDFYNYDPHVLFLVFIYGINSLRDVKRQPKLNNAVINILRKIFICSGKNITNNIYKPLWGIGGNKNVLRYTSDLSDDNPINKVFLNNIKNIIDICISNKDKDDITSNAPKVSSSIIKKLNEIRVLTLDGFSYGNSLQLNINSKDLNTYLRGAPTTGLIPTLTIDECNGILESNILELKYLNEETPTYYEEQQINTENSDNSNGVGAKSGKPKKGGASSIKNRFFGLLKNYEIKLLTDYETLNTNYLSYYVDDKKSETKFYLADDIIIHVFLSNLLDKIENERITNIDLTNITSCLNEIIQINSNKKIVENSKNLVSAISEIESYLMVNTSNKSKIHKDTYTAVLDCVSKLQRDVDNINKKAFNLNGAKLLNYVFDNNITQGSYINLINAIEGAFHKNLDSINSGINSPNNVSNNVNSINSINNISIEPSKSSKLNYNSGINSNINIQSSKNSRKRSKSRSKRAFGNKKKPSVNKCPTQKKACKCPTQKRRPKRKGSKKRK